MPPLKSRGLCSHAISSSYRYPVTFCGRLRMAQILERYVLYCAHRVFSIGTGLVPTRGRRGIMTSGGRQRDIYIERERKRKRPRTKSTLCPPDTGVDSVKMISLVNLSFSLSAATRTIRLARCHAETDRLLPRDAEFCKSKKTGGKERESWKLVRDFE